MFFFIILFLFLIDIIDKARITLQKLPPMRVQYTGHVIQTETVLYQFLETGTSDRTFMGLDQELK